MAVKREALWCVNHEHNMTHKVTRHKGCVGQGDEKDDKGEETIADCKEEGEETDCECEDDNVAEDADCKDEECVGVACKIEEGIELQSEVESKPCKRRICCKHTGVHSKDGELKCKDSVLQCKSTRLLCKDAGLKGMGGDLPCKDLQLYSQNLEHMCKDAELQCKETVQQNDNTVARLQNCKSSGLQPLESGLQCKDLRLGEGEEKEDVDDLLELQAQLSQVNNTPALTAQFQTKRRKSASRKYKRNGLGQTDMPRTSRSRMRMQVQLCGAAVQMWASIGQAEGLTSDPDIALFLLQHYRKTQALAGGGATCSICQKPLSLLCKTCDIYLPPPTTPSSLHTTYTQAARAEPKRKKATLPVQRKKATPPVQKKKATPPVQRKKATPPVQRKRRKKETRAAPLPTVAISATEPSSDSQTSAAAAGDGDYDDNGDGGGNGEDNKMENGDDAGDGALVQHFKTETGIETKDEPTEGEAGKSTGGEASKVFRCTVCSQVYTRACSLKAHMRKHTGEKPFVCPHCSAAFSLSGSLIVHMRTHTGDKPYVCEDCGRHFAISSGLKQHRRQHTGEKPYRCSICPAAYSRSDSLKVHMRSHSGLRPFICEECGADFSRLYCLLAHKKKHTGERPFQCPVCQATFTQSGKLTIHMRKHTGDRPFQCEQCGASFAQSDRLKTHLRTHSGERPYACPHCPKAFSHPHSLKVHMRAHTGHRPYKCHVCSLTFADPSYFRRHKAKHASDGDVQSVTLPGQGSVSVAAARVSVQYPTTDRSSLSATLVVPPCTPCNVTLTSTPSSVHPICLPGSSGLSLHRSDLPPVESSVGSQSSLVESSAGLPVGPSVWSSIGSSVSPCVGSSVLPSIGVATGSPVTLSVGSSAGSSVGLPAGTSAVSTSLPSVRFSLAISSSVPSLRASLPASSVGFSVPTSSLGFSIPLSSVGYSVPSSSPTSSVGFSVPSTSEGLSASSVGLPVPPSSAGFPVFTTTVPSLSSDSPSTKTVVVVCSGGQCDNGDISDAVSASVGAITQTSGMVTNTSSSDLFSFLPCSPQSNTSFLS